MSSLPRPMVSVGAGASLLPSLGPAPSPGPALSPGAAYSLLGHYGRLAAASWRRHRDAAPPGCHFAYFIFGHKRRWCPTLSTASRPLHWMVRRTDVVSTTRTQRRQAQGCQAHSESLAHTGMPRPAGRWPYLSSGVGCRVGIALDRLTRRPRSAEEVPGGGSSSLRGDGLLPAKCLSWRLILGLGDGHRPAVALVT